MFKLIKNLFKIPQRKKDYNVHIKRYKNKVVTIRPEVYFDTCNARPASEVFPDEIIDHPLVNKTLIDENNTEYIVLKASKKWFGGFYITLLAQCKDHKTLIHWQDVNCICDIILEEIESNNVRFKLKD